MDFGLQKKRALVTGANSGIGAAIAEALAKEGAEVVVHGRNRERTLAVVDKIKGSGGKAVAVIGDLVTPEGAASVVEASSAAFGGIDILVNNAGGSVGSDAASWFDNPPEAWVDNYLANTVSAVRLIHAFVPTMIDQGWGRVIQISSGTAVNARVYTPAYSAAKAGGNNLVSSLSKALAKTGVTSNAVMPGLIRTPLLEDWLGRVAEQNDFDDIAKAEQHVLSTTVLQTVGRLGEPFDIAWAVLYLASPHSGFVNGAIMRVEGGSNPTVNN